MAGVKWVIRLQLVLLLVLFLSAADLLIGSLVHTDPGMLQPFVSSNSNNNIPLFCNQFILIISGARSTSMS